MNRRNARWALAGIVLVSLLVNVFPISWGLPSRTSWAFDELAPRDVRDGTRDLLQGRERWRYPPLHYLVLSGAQRSVDLVIDLAGREPTRATTRYVYHLASRSVSVLMAALIVWLVYRSARQLFDRGTALLAAACMAVVCPFLYYSKTANLDVPYLFWFAAAILFYLKALRRHRLRDYLVLAVMVSLSVCTKDQAFALFVLAPLLLIASLRTWRQQHGQSRRWISAVIDRRVVLAALVAALVFSLIHNLLFDWRGFMSHVDAMRDISGRSAEFANTVRGQVALLGQSVRNTTFSFGLPLSLVALIGVVSAVKHWRSRRLLVSLLVFPISYHLFFISLVRYSYDRFMLPVSLVLTFFAAPVLARLVRSERLPRLVRSGAVVLLLGYTLAYSFSIDLRMYADSRNAARDWFERTLQPGDTVLGVGSERAVPSGFPRLDTGPFEVRGLAHLQRRDPDYLLILPRSLGQRTRRLLLLGRLNYRQVASFEGDPLYDLLDFGGVRSNLETVSPRVEVYGRSDRWGLTHAEVRQELLEIEANPDPIRRAALAARIAAEPTAAKASLVGDILVGASLLSLQSGSVRLAALVVTNPGSGPLALPIRVVNHSQARGGEPFGFIVDDGREGVRHDLTVPGHLRFELPSVPPGEQRLFLLKTTPDGAGLWPQVQVKAQVFRQIEGTEMVTLGLSGDGWTTGSPAIVVEQNISGEARSIELRLACWANDDELPITVRTVGARGERQVVIETPGIHRVSLWEIPGFSDEALVLTTDRTWQEPGGKRRLGVQLLSPVLEGR